MLLSFQFVDEDEESATDAHRVIAGAQALKQNGVEKFSPLGRKFDPNLHSALFQIPDAAKEAGTILVVTKVRFLLDVLICSALCQPLPTVGILDKDMLNLHSDMWQGSG